MRWFPTLVFSHSSCNSSTSTSSEDPGSLRSCSPSTSSWRKNSRTSAWFFGSGKRSTRSRKLSHIPDLDTLVVPPLCRSSSSCVQPQPLPLPRDADYRFPSPKDATAPLDVTLTPGFRMRSVFASQETKPVVAHAQQQDSRSGGASTNNRWLGVPARSAPTSPFASPRINDDFIPYYFVSSKGMNQFWSAPEMPTFDASSPAFTDNNTTLSPHQSPRGKSPTGPSSIPPRLSIDTAIARRETTAPITVHPLPLPPWAGPGAPLLSPSSAFSPPVASKIAESLPMKNQWQKGKLLGRGTFGTVYAATNRKTGALCAMKEAEIFADDPKSAECIKQLEQEIKFLSHLKHPNIVQYYGSEIVENRFYIYLEYVHPGSMNKYVRDHCGAITECIVRSFTRHILSGLAYLHSKKTIHRDIKGANLLVDSAGVVKLADFGMAKHLTGHAADLSLKGSPYWMAPELLQEVVQKDNNSDVALAVDIWSLGCTIIEMFTGKPPWSEYEGAAAMFKVMKDTPPIPETLSAEGKDFLRLCFIRNPAERPTASMLLEHRFLKNLQQPDVSSSMQLYNFGTTFTMDINSPRELSENKLDQISFPKGKLVAESGIAMPYSLYSSSAS